MTSKQQMIEQTRHWLERAVIGLNLCPFAKAVHVKQRIRYVVSSALDQQTLLVDVLEELQRLYDAQIDDIETTLLIIPHVFQDFLQFNDFLDYAEQAVGELSLDGEIQIASFHPEYQFAGTSPWDVENYTNRSPWPCLHLLRESSVARAVATYPDTAQIYQRNIETLKKLGREGWEKLMRD
jgi:uncharacterized protein